jgi:hypothetical protein
MLTLTLSLSPRVPQARGVFKRRMEAAAREVAELARRVAVTSGCGGARLWLLLRCWRCSHAHAHAHALAHGHVHAHQHPLPPPHTHTRHARDTSHTRTHTPGFTPRTPRVCVHVRMCAWACAYVCMHWRAGSLATRWRWALM